MKNKPVATKTIEKFNFSFSCVSTASFKLGPEVGATLSTAISEADLTI